MASHFLRSVSKDNALAAAVAALLDLDRFLVVAVDDAVVVVVVFVAAAAAAAAAAVVVVLVVEFEGS